MLKKIQDKALERLKNTLFSSCKLHVENTFDKLSFNKNRMQAYE